MTTKQMEYILELSRSQNFNRAAEKLFITQPALTYQIQRAEEEIGAPLFTRSGKGAVLTAAGERFVASIEGILADYNDAVEEAKALNPGHVAAIRLAVPERVAVPGLTERLEAFSEENPNVPVALKRFLREDFRGTELPEADLVIMLEDRHVRKYHGWKEAARMEAYVGADELPLAPGRQPQDMGVDDQGFRGKRPQDMGAPSGAASRSQPQDIVVGQGRDLIWVPYVASPVFALLWQKNDEKREIIHKLVQKFV